MIIFFVGVLGRAIIGRGAIIGGGGRLFFRRCASEGDYWRGGRLFFRRGAWEGDYWRGGRLLEVLRYTG